MRLRAPFIGGINEYDNWNREIYSAVSGRLRYPLGTWARTDVAASQTNSNLFLLGSSDNDLLAVAFPGDLVGISVASSEARTAGTLTVRTTINGTGSDTLTATLDATNTQFDFGQLRHSVLSFVQRGRIGVQVTTNAAWLPVTADIVVGVWILN